MNIIQRNFFRLIRIGAFEQKEQIEPMSVYKWGQLFQLAVMHDVAGYVYEGLQHCKDQFFLHLTDKQWQLWEKTIQEIRKKARNAEEEPDEFLRADHLTNPLLNKKLQTILDDEQSDIHTRQVLLTIMHLSPHGWTPRRLHDLRQMAQNAPTATGGQVGSLAADGTVGI